MSETQNVYGVNESNAILLLEAAQKLDLDPAVVATTTSGYFTVPAEVAAKAGFDENGLPTKADAKKAAKVEGEKEAEAQAAREADEQQAKDAAETLQKEADARAKATKATTAKSTTAKKATTAKSGS